MYCLLLVVTTGNYLILKLGSKVVPVVQSTDYRQPIFMAVESSAASFLGRKIIFNPPTVLKTLYIHNIILFMSPIGAHSGL